MRDREEDRVTGILSFMVYRPWGKVNSERMDGMEADRHGWSGGREQCREGEGEI